MDIEIAAAVSSVDTQALGPVPLVSHKGTIFHYQKESESRYWSVSMILGSKKSRVDAHLGQAESGYINRTPST